MPLAVLCSPGSPPRRLIRFLAARRRGYPRVLCSLLYSTPLCHSCACCAQLGLLPGAKGPTSGSVAAGGEPLHLLPLELGAASPSTPTGIGERRRSSRSTAVVVDPGGGGRGYNARQLERPVHLKQGPLGQRDSASIGERAKRGTGNTVVDRDGGQCRPWRSGWRLGI
jgi:hypothetical protein